MGGGDLNELLIDLSVIGEGGTLGVFSNIKGVDYRFSLFEYINMSIFIIYTPDLPTFAPHGVSLDMTDELATARRRCKHLLTRVFGMVSLSLTAWLFTRLARTESVEYYYLCAAMRFL